MPLPPLQPLQLFSYGALGAAVAYLFVVIFPDIEAWAKGKPIKVHPWRLIIWGLTYVLGGAFTTLMVSNASYWRDAAIFGMAWPTIFKGGAGLVSLATKVPKRGK